MDANGCTVSESAIVILTDEDKDGVPNEDDVCPGTLPGVRVDQLGCPLNIYDKDFDGVTDDIDVCPNTL